MLLITQYFPPDLGGSSTRAANLVKGITQNGFNVDVITTVPHYPRGNARAWRDMRFFRKLHGKRVHIVRLWMPKNSHETTPSRILNYLFFTFASCLASLSVRKPDVVVSTSPNFFCYVTGLFVKATKRVPTVLNVDDLWPEALKDLEITKNSFVLWLIREARRMLLNLSDHVICISDSIREALTYSGVSPHQVSTVEVGFDFDKIDHRFALKPPNDEVFRVVYSGVLGYAYDFDALMQIAALCSLNEPRIKFLLKGQGPEANRIRKLIDESRANNVELVDSWMPEEEYVAFLARSNAFILPMRDISISKTALPTKLFEYMALARPVVVVGEGEVANLVRTTGSGIAVTKAHLKEAAEYLGDLVAGRLDSHHVGQAGRKHIQHEFSVPRIGRKLSKILKRLIHEAATRESRL